ncbi:MAG: magnesium transporter, partial [Alphaproteobacteria bacterium]
RPIGVSDIMHTEMHAIPLEMDQEDVALFFRQYSMVSAPVVDAQGQLVGVITIDDIVDVIHDEHEEDLMHLGGVAEDDFYHDILRTMRSRFSWLLVNLGTAIVASIAIGFFDAAIEQVVALAILMPIVASMGGNAGTQTMTVAVRAMAMKELNPANAMRIVGKEVVVGTINGMLFALLAGLIAWIWFGNPVLGGIIGLAMVINLVAAAFTGVAIPLLLDRAGIDPAIASAVILTTVTDVIGFVAFLGLAALVLL